MFAPLSNSEQSNALIEKGSSNKRSNQAACNHILNGVNPMG